jgi:hypothetical protein
MPRLATAALATAALAIAGCGGDDDGEPTAPMPPAATTTQPDQPDRTEPRTTPEAERLERTPRSLADCIREADGVEEVVIKGREGEDAVFFEELVGGRVDVLGVTLTGVSGEVSVFLFASERDAAKALPSAGGGGVRAEAAGSAVVAAPPGTETGPVSDCLAATGYS